MQTGLGMQQGRGLRQGMVGTSASGRGVACAWTGEVEVNGCTGVSTRMVRLGDGDGALEREGGVGRGGEGDSVTGLGTMGAGVACTAGVIGEGVARGVAWSDVNSTFDSAASSCWRAYAPWLSEHVVRRRLDSWKMTKAKYGRECDGSEKSPQLAGGEEATGEGPVPAHDAVRGIAEDEEVENVRPARASPHR